MCIVLSVAMALVFTLFSMVLIKIGEVNKRLTNSTA